MRRAIRVTAAGACLAALGLVAATPAAAQNVKISEVFISSTAPTTNFVELQFSGPAAGTALSIDVYQFGPTPEAQCTGGIPANTASQRTFLIGAPGVAGADSTCPALGSMTSTGAGYVCALQAGSEVDNVAWGTFSSSPFFCLAPSPNNVAPAGIPNGSSISRQIARGCATLLDAPDDSNDSAADFAVTSPSPRPNSAAPTEQPCVDGPGDPVTPPDTTAPETAITEGPKEKSKSKSASFAFSSTEPGSTFECSLNGGPFTPCTSPHDVKGKKGKNTFAVRATDAAGNVDPSPATDEWTVKKKKKKK